MESLVSEYAFLDDLLSPDYDALIVDAGGYIGTAAIAMAKRFPKAQIITIEPSSDNFSVLQNNIKPYSNISARNAALGVNEGEIITLHNRGTGNWGFTTISRPKDNTKPDEIEAVSTVSIDQLSKELGRVPGFLKLDIEGGEKSILDNGAEQLKLIPIVFIELHDRIVDGCKESFLAFSSER